VPGELRALFDEAIDSGLIEDYLVPPEGYLQRKGERDDRVIWRLMKHVRVRSLSWGGVAEPVNGSEPGASKICGQDV
jgi:hypothetical protein